MFERTKAGIAVAQRHGGSASAFHNRTMKKIILFIMFLLALPAQAQAELVVHFLDVGQGDAALVLCDGESMLIDGGPTSASQLVYTYVKQNTDRLDYIVATHPH